MGLRKKRVTLSDGKIGYRLGMTPSEAEDRHEANMRNTATAIRNRVVRALNGKGQ